ncbi:MAG: carotenoid oxygenase family protein, partial [Myxococcota bacterium]
MDAAQLPWSRLKVEGKVPKELYGTLFRNGPAGFERGRARYQHWFDGDGLVHGFRLDGHGVRHHARKVATEKWKREAEAGRFLVSGAGSRIPDSVPSRGNDDGNPANISVVPWGEDLLALWEAGSPYALDPQTLKTRRRVTWSENADHLPFSAHPLFEKDGRMWNCGLAQWAG